DFATVLAGCMCADVAPGTANQRDTILRRRGASASGNVVSSAMFEDHEHLFPRAEDVPHLAIPFLKLMFAHANFEEVFRDLQNIVAKDETFSESGKNRWPASDRPEKIRQLMTDHGCKDAEIATAH